MNPADLFWAEDHRKHRETFVQSLLDKGDDLGAVVRAQVFVEYYLQAAIESALKEPSVLGPRFWADYLGFEGRLRLFRGLGGELNDNLCKRMRSLATIRNSLAHKIAASVAQEDARHFMSSLTQIQVLVVDALGGTSDWRQRFRVALWIHVAEVQIAATVFKKRYDRLRPLIEEQFRTFQVILHADDLGAGEPLRLLAGNDGARS